MVAPVKTGATFFGAGSPCDEIIIRLRYLHPKEHGMKIRRLVPLAAGLCLSFAQAMAATPPASTQEAVVNHYADLAEVMYSGGLGGGRARRGAGGGGRARPAGRAGGAARAAGEAARGPN